MKKIPKKTKQWASEAYESLEKAIVLFREEFPDPSEEDKLELIRYALPFAALNRGIRDKSIVKKASEYVLDNLAADFQAKEENEPIYHSISFLLAYLDSHVSFGKISENKAEEIMEYLSENYEINITA